MTSDNSLLTRAELQLMLHLWSLPGSAGFTSDVLACFEEPRPAYTTVATFMKILTKKGFLRAVKTGNALYYTARISREDYLHATLSKLCDDFFDGDSSQLLRYVERHFSL